MSEIMQASVPLFKGDLPRSGSVSDGQKISTWWSSESPRLGTGGMATPVSRLGLFPQYLKCMTSRAAALFGTTAMSKARSLRRDDRGAIVPMVALPLVVLIGMTSLAVEAGLWYVEYREGQNTADAAAVAAAMTMANSGDPTSTNDPSDVKGLAGSYDLTDADVASLIRAATANSVGGQMNVHINRPPKSGNFTTDNTAVEAVVLQPRTAGLSSLLGVKNVDIRNRAVATVDYINGACVLSLKKSLTIWGNYSITAPLCSLASNALGNYSIKAGGSATIAALSMNAYGNCNGCDDPTIVNLTIPARSYSIKSEDRFEKLNSVVWPVFSGSTCDNTYIGTSTSNLTLHPTYANVGSDPSNPLPTNGGKAYCGGIHMSGSDRIDLTPGIYVFKESDITADGGVLTCSTCTIENGVHLVQIDKTANVNQFIINGSALVVLNAGLDVPAVPGVGSDISYLAGVLFYRTNDSQDSVGDEIVINGNADTILTGGLYAPNGDFRFNGNSKSDCTVIVAAGVTMNGDSVFNGSGCTDMGLKIAKTRVVSLKE